MIRALLVLATAGCLSKPPEPPGGDGGMPHADLSGLGVGANHACAIDGQKRLFCWGDNSATQLGDGELFYAASHQVGTETGWTEVSGGNGHTCGMLNDHVRCWGDNGVSQTDGGSVDRDLQLPGFTAVHVYAHGSGTCALDAAGHAMCWGGYAVQPPTDPVAIDFGGTGLAFAQIVFNDDHGCALTTDGTAYCWGDNSHGQANTSTTTMIKPAAATARAGSYLQLGVGAQVTCGLTAAHAIECWGDPDSPHFEGKGGGGSRSDGTVVDTQTWDALSVGNYFACGRIGTNAFCWGYDDEGQLGDGPMSHTILATPMATTATDVRIGGDFACMLEVAGTVRCWGQNRYGNLGNGEVARASAPVLITPTVESPFVHLAAGEAHVCGVREDGAVFCWGANNDHKVDWQDPAEAFDVPHRVATVVGGEITAGRNHTCVLEDVTGHAICWGDNQFGQLGSGTAGTTHSTVAMKFTSISAGPYATCAVAADGVYCWGLIPGDGSNSTPKKVLPGTAFKQVVVGESYAAATDDTQVLGFGDHCAAVGTTGTKIPYATPLMVPGVTGVKFELAAGGGDLCARIGFNSGPAKMKCWGTNGYTELSNTSGCVAPVERSMPIPIGEPDINHRGGTVALSGGHGCILDNDSTVMCWGDDAELQIGVRGDEDASQIDEVFGVAGSDVHFLDFTLGPSFGCGSASSGQTITAGAVLCWGTSIHGELGNGTAFRNKPVLVQ